MKIINFVAGIWSAAVVTCVKSCYYNHELSVSKDFESTFHFKWRDVHSGPFPGIGMEISLLTDNIFDDIAVELEGQDVTAVLAENTTFEISIPFGVNGVEVREKTLCDWRYGCAHCDHVATEICGPRLAAIVNLKSDLSVVNIADADLVNKIIRALQTIASALKTVCQNEESTYGEEEYLMNDIVQTCIEDCLTM